MFLDSIPSHTNLAAQGEQRLMKGDDNSLDYSESLAERANLVNQTYKDLQGKIKAVVHFPRQKEKLLQEINLLYSKFFEKKSEEELSKLVINISSQIGRLESIDPIITHYIQKFNGLKKQIDAEGKVVDGKRLIVDSMDSQYEALKALVDVVFEKIDSFNPLQRNQEGKYEYPASYFISELDADFNRLNAAYIQFQSENGSILGQREKAKNQLKEEVESLKRKVSPFSLVRDELDDLEEDINKLNSLVKKGINEADDKLQQIKNTVEMGIADAAAKSKLLNFLAQDCHPIGAIRTYETKLNQAGKTAKAKAKAFSSIIEKFNLIQDCASTFHGVSSKEIVDKVEILEDEIRNQKDTLAQYRGIAFFRPLMRCIGKGEVTSLKHVNQLEDAIERFKSSVKPAI